MHYSFPFIETENNTKILVTISSAVLIFLSILYIAYHARCSYLITQSTKFNFSSDIDTDPLLSFMLFFGLQGPIVHTINIIQTWNSSLLPLSKNIKWSIIWWMMVSNAGFTFTCAIGGAQNMGIVQYITDIAQIQLLSTNSSQETINYYLNWIHINRFSKGIMVLQFILGIPLITLLVLGLLLHKKKAKDTNIKVMSQIRGSSTTATVKISQTQLEMNPQ